MFLLYRSLGTTVSLGPGPSASFRIYNPRENLFKFKWVENHTSKFVVFPLAHSSENSFFNILTHNPAGKPSTIKVSFREWCIEYITHGNIYWKITQQSTLKYKYIRIYSRIYSNTHDLNKGYWICKRKYCREYENTF